MDYNELLRLLLYMVGLLATIYTEWVEIMAGMWPQENRIGSGLNVVGNKAHCGTGEMGVLPATTSRPKSKEICKAGLILHADDKDECYMGHGRMDRMNAVIVPSHNPNFALVPPCLPVLESASTTLR